MLDAYIIDRIRREQERTQQIDRRIPLHIERPVQIEGPSPDGDDRPAERRPGERGGEREGGRSRPDPDRQERGSVEIDFTL
jgi:hypothetical protein